VTTPITIDFWSPRSGAARRRRGHTVDGRRGGFDLKLRVTEAATAQSRARTETSSYTEQTGAAASIPTAIR